MEVLNLSAASLHDNEKNLMAETNHQNSSLEDEALKNESRLDATIVGCLLSIVVISLFQRINFLLKMCLMTLTALVQITIYTFISKPSQQYGPPTKNNELFAKGSSSNQSILVEKDELVISDKPILGSPHENNYYEWPVWLEPALLMTLLIILLHLLDRQIELTSRSDFLWMTKLSSEEEGGDTMLGINKVMKHLYE